jgi:hypothetical protein
MPLKNLCEAGRILDLPVLDYLVIFSEYYFCYFFDWLHVFGQNQTFLSNFL